MYFRPLNPNPGSKLAHRVKIGRKNKKNGRKFAKIWGQKTLNDIEVTLPLYRCVFLAAGSKSGVRISPTGQSQQMAQNCPKFGAKNIEWRSGDSTIVLVFIFVHWIWIRWSITSKDRTCASEFPGIFLGRPTQPPFFPNHIAPETSKSLLSIHKKSAWGFFLYSSLFVYVVCTRLHPTFH